MEEALREEIGKALANIPGTLYVMTAHDEDRSEGVLVSFVQQVSFEPPMVMVSLNKGREIIPLIHDSHAFALCQVKKDDRYIKSKFSRPKDYETDRFEGMEIFRDKTGSPILKRCVTYLDCKLIRHLDVDADHDIYIGQIKAVGFPLEGEYEVRTREDGFEY